MPDATAILTRMKATCEAATKGPWTTDVLEIYVFGPDSKMVADRDFPDGEIRGRGVGAGLPIAKNLAFIAAARTGWPATIRALGVAREKLRHVEQVTGYSVGADEIDRILEGREPDFTPAEIEDARNNPRVCAECAEKGETNGNV